MEQQRSYRLEKTIKASMFGWSLFALTSHVIRMEGRKWAEVSSFFPLCEQPLVLNIKTLGGFLCSVDWSNHRQRQTSAWWRCSVASLCWSDVLLQQFYHLVSFFRPFEVNWLPCWPAAILLYCIFTLRSNVQLDCIRILISLLLFIQDPTFCLSFELLHFFINGWNTFSNRTSANCHIITVSSFFLVRSLHH